MRWEYASTVSASRSHNTTPVAGAEAAVVVATRTGYSYSSECGRAPLVLGSG